MGFEIYSELAAVWLRIGRNVIKTPAKYCAAQLAPIKPYRRSPHPYLRIFHSP